jgi:hypothetical protein
MPLTGGMLCPNSDRVVPVFDAGAIVVGQPGIGRRLKAVAHADAAAPS